MRKAVSHSQEGIYHGVMLLQDLHVMDEFVLFLSHTLVMHPVEIALFAKFVPSGRCLHQQCQAEVLDRQATHDVPSSIRVLGHLLMIAFPSQLEAVQ